MAVYEHGDYIKVEFKDDRTGESEWMWVMVDHADDIELWYSAGWTTSRS